MGKIYMFLFLILAWCSMASPLIASARGIPAAVSRAGNDFARQISGRVTDENGSGIPGANVLIEGTTQGTVTDADGKYTIEIPSDETVLVFSFIGYATQKITVGTLAAVDVTLIPDVQALDEIVVTGYSTQRRATLTGAVSVIETKDIVRTKNENVLNSMTGKLPGVRIVQRAQRPALMIPR